MVPVLVTAAILFNSEGRILIAQRNNESKLASKWEFPGGKIEPRETPQKCLYRELIEEMGIHVQVGFLFERVYHSYDHGSIELQAYLCSIDKGNPQALEHQEIRWVAIQDILKYDLAPADIPIAQKLIREGEALVRNRENI